jgi:protein SERAC1
LKTLRVAKHSKSQFQRTKAINNLCSKKLDLDEWEFQYLAQYCDSATAVQLARHFCNPNIIKKPREFGKLRTKNDIINDIKELFESIENSPCIKFIFENTKAFENIRDVDHDASLIDLHEENDHIIESLDHFVHLSNNPENSLKIAQNGGLEILSDIHRHFEGNFDIRMILTKIVTNMSSAHESITDYFHKSGWIYLLSRWQVDSDLRIQVLASTGLSNLDKFDKSNFIYQPKLYPLYPRGRLNAQPDADLIFVHGILGGIFITWRVQKESDLDLTVVKNENSKLINSFFQEEGIFKDEKIVQMEPGTASKFLTITEQTTQSVLKALNEMVEENLSNSDVSERLNFQVIMIIMNLFIVVKIITSNIETTCKKN